MSSPALFHLVPRNGPAIEALQHVDNIPFVSPSAEGMPGLEIGFHVPPFSRGHVITRLGRKGDLILRESYSAVHVAFEVHPDTHLVVLSVRTKRVSSVTVQLDEAEEEIPGDCALIYGRQYNINIAS